MSVIAGQGMGTVCSIDMSRHNNGIKTVKLGFDFDWNPVCFLSLQSDIFGQIAGFDALIQDEWSEVSIEYQPQTAIGYPTALELKQHQGLWALKGDRWRGLNIRVGDVADLRILREVFQGKLVWVMQLHFRHYVQVRRNFGGLN